jgi:hypothetical protein
VTALEEEIGAARVHAHQIPYPLATEAGRKRRRRWSSHRRRSASTVHTRRCSRTLAASRSAEHPASAATPLATKASHRAEREDRDSGR